MNKALVFFLVPCVVAFVMVQAQYGQFGGLGQAAAGFNNYGQSPYGAYGRSPAYYGGALARTREDSWRYLAMIAGLLGFFAVWFAQNNTGSIVG